MYIYRGFATDRYHDHGIMSSAVSGGSTAAINPSSWPRRTNFKVVVDLPQLRYGTIWQAVWHRPCEWWVTPSAYYRNLCIFLAMNQVHIMTQNTLRDFYDSHHLLLWLITHIHYFHHFYLSIVITPIHYTHLLTYIMIIVMHINKPTYYYIL